MRPDDEPTGWACLAARAADDKQGRDPVVLAVGDVLAVTDHFVITSASNDRLVRTIVEEVERRVADAGGPKPLRVEGLDDMRWVLMDYGAFVVHVLSDDARRYYDLERLWSDVPKLDWRADAATA
ncbi:MAG: ribosome silencing factor [Actinobacteria bacterium]|nr:ribosome silencing factor [Actinomycetota bacterium]